MPLDPASPIIQQIGWKIIIDGFRLQFNDLANDSLQLLDDIADAFPNPLLMLDVLVEFWSGLVGRLLGTPFAGIEAQMLKLVKLTGLGSRLLTLNSAIRLQSASLREIMLNFTGTSSNSLQSALLQATALWVWRLRERFKLLQLLIRVKTFEEFYKNWIVVRLSRKALFYSVGLIVVAFFSVMAWIGILASLIGIVVMVLSGNLTKFLLPQDSRRVWRERGGMGRVNLRVGADQ
jgi:hypothetical protein